MNQDIYNAAMGCLLGSLAGDAAGATLEFMLDPPTLDRVIRAMDMPGGGRIGVAPGQITDDGELTLCLARALAKSKTFNIETIARNYAEWVESRPFDMGFTTSTSLGSYRSVDVSQEGYAAVMKSSAANYCMGSKANGSLMRITPLAIWGHGLETNQLAECAMADTSLSHPNASCGYAVACYCIAIATFIDNPGNREQAFNNARSWLNAQANLTEDSDRYHCWAEVSSWLIDAEDNVNVPYEPQIGFVKIAFTHAFRHLLVGSSYEDAMVETLCGGGDTDTNACIVGGLIGAAVGVENIPLNMRKAVLESDTSKGRHHRPEWLHPSQVEKLVTKLF